MKSSIFRLTSHSWSYLLVLKAGTYQHEGGPGNLGLARQSYQAAIDREPGIDAAWWGLTMISLEAKEYDRTVILLTTMHQKFGVNLRGLLTLPVFADFIQSDAYRNWAARPQ